MKYGNLSVLRSMAAVVTHFNELTHLSIAHLTPSHLGVGAKHCEMKLRSLFREFIWDSGAALGVFAPKPSRLDECWHFTESTKPSRFEERCFGRSKDRGKKNRLVNGFQVVALFSLYIHNPLPFLFCFPLSCLLMRLPLSCFRLFF